MKFSSDEAYEVYFLYSDDELEHSGTPQHIYNDPNGSGLYRLGTGKNPYQHLGDFSAAYNKAHREGLSDKEIAESYGMSIDQMRALKTYDTNKYKMERDAKIWKLYDKGWSKLAIAKEMGIPDTTVGVAIRNREKREQNSLINTVETLKEAVEKDTYIDSGKGVNRHLGITETKLKDAVNILKSEGYTVETMSVKQLSTNNFTNLRVLAPPDTTRKEIFDNLTNIKLPFKYSPDGGETYEVKEPPVNIDSKRILIRYAEEGGVEKDGVIELRRDVPDLDLGKAHYAQVRVAVDGTSYLKGMAMYTDEKLPKGIDIVYNTNKKKGTPAYKVFKDQDGVEDGQRIKPPSDPMNPFGASIKDEDDLLMVNRRYVGKDGKSYQSALNIVNEEGAWSKWSKTLASQFLGKQKTEVAKKQLDLDAAKRYAEYEEIMSLTNPAVKKKLLQDFSDECDSAAVHMTAAGMPRQQTHVLLPNNDLKDNEIYAPNYKNGEEVILVRYPHGGLFEIPRLKVNNKIKSAIDTIGNARDAVMISGKTAEQLSGADFDGDTALVIPTKGQDIKTMKAIKGLATFDTKTYKIPEEDLWSEDNKKGIKPMDKKTRNREMGVATNLITDMSVILGSGLNEKSPELDEVVRATKYSMVVIDAYKHKLNWKQAYEDYGIKELQEKYQYNPETGKGGGASTLLSRTTSEERVPKRKSYYKIDPKTGEKIFELETDPRKNSYSKPKKNKNGEVVEWKTEQATTKSTKGYEHDPYELMSSYKTPMEYVYADYACDMKSLGDKARLGVVNAGSQKKVKGMAEKYADEVNSLESKLVKAESNAPLERQAQLLGNKMLELYKIDHPEIKDDGDKLKKKKNEYLQEARKQVGAGKEQIYITDKEWEAIQAGAISNAKLEDIMANTDTDRLKQLAMPKEERKIADSTKERIKNLAKSGATTSQIAEATGYSVSTVQSIL